MHAARTAKPLLGEADHFIRHIHPVKFAEVAGHGAHQPPRAATHLEPAPGLRRDVARQALQFVFEQPHDVPRGSEKLFVLLAAPPARDIIPGILSRAPIPVRAHLFEYFRVRHSPPFYLQLN